jgi:cell division protein FtsB
MRRQKKNPPIDREKIKQLFKNELITGLKHLYISNDSKGIKLFGEYQIKKTVDEYYVVRKHYWEQDREFTTVRAAMSYCVLHHNRHTETAIKIYKLDSKLASIDLDIAVHTRGYKNTKSPLDRRLIQLTKLQHDLEKKKQIVMRLEGHINTSKETQRAIFEEQKKNRGRKAKNSTVDDKYIYSSTDY